MPKAYSYIRFSCLKEFDPNKLKYQLEEAKEYARSRNLIFDDMLSFQDLGVSGFKGYNKKSGKLGLFLFAVKYGIVEQGSYLIIENLDRLSRDSARHALRTLEEIVDFGITVVTLTDRKEYTSETLDNNPIDLLYSILIFIRANEESLTKSKRGKAVWKRKIKAARGGDKSKIMGGFPRWLDYVDGKFVINEERAKTVKKMFNMSKVGMGAAAISTYFNEMSIPTLTGLPIWRGGTVLYCLRNESVTGRYVPKTKKFRDGITTVEKLPAVDDFYPRVISERTWHLVQKEIDRRKNRSPAFCNGTSNQVRNIFGRLGRCNMCGGPMTLKRKNLMFVPYNVNHAYLSCGSRYQKIKCGYQPVLYRPLHLAFLKGGTEMIDGHLTCLLEKEQFEIIGSKNLELALLIPKADSLKFLLSQTDPDRRSLNRSLRNLFSSVVINIEHGRLDFYWAYGGVSELSFLKENNDFIKELIRDLEISPT